MSLYPVISQRLPELTPKDIDDCAVVATVWAARDADHCSRRPTIPEFRAAAGNPDDPTHPDGLTNRQVADAVPKIWPLAKSMRLETQSWTAFMSYLDRGDSISIAVNSANLPANLRFGFYGSHRVGVRKVDGVIYMANPLAENGSKPIAITESALRRAMTSIVRAVGWIYAVAFRRQPVHLRYGGRKTKPIPDRTRGTGGGFIRTAPRVADKYKVRALGKGQLFAAYQVTDDGDEFKGSTRWYGNHKGDRWVHASRLSHKGGST